MQETIEETLLRPWLLVIVGPCSIHDLKSAKEYANRLKELAKKVEKSMFLVMRVYFANCQQQ